MPFDAPGVRVGRFEESLRVLKGLLAARVHVCGRALLGHGSGGIPAAGAAAPPADPSGRRQQADARGRSSTARSAINTSSWAPGRGGRSQARTPGCRLAGGCRGAAARPAPPPAPCRRASRGVGPGAGRGSSPARGRAPEPRRGRGRRAVPLARSRCWMGGGTRLPGPRAVLGAPSRLRLPAAAASAVAADCSTSAPTAPAHCRVRSRVGARARPPPAGLAAQPLPGRPGRGRTRLRAGRAARQRQRRRRRAGHHLAVAAQGLRSPRPGHAGPQPRGGPPARHRRQPARAAQPAAPPLDPAFVALNPAQLPAARGPRGEQGVRLRRTEEIETLSYRTVVELNAESRLAPQRRVAAIARRPGRAQRLASDRTGRANRRHVDREQRGNRRADRTDRTSRPYQPKERGMVADAR
jgi:hypothetical protein